MISTLLLGQVAVESLPSVPGEGGFFSLVKIIVMTVFLFLWAFPAGWCSRDAKRLSLNQFIWGGIIMCGGILGWFFWFFVPMFMVGFLFFVLFGYGGDFDVRVLPGLDRGGRG